MAYVRDQTVDIPPVSKKIPPNPLLGYNRTHTATASSAKSSRVSATQSTLTHRVLLYDQRCLVTGAVSTQLQACHLINTIRMNNSNREIKAPLKDEVVRSLSLIIPDTLGGCNIFAQESILTQQQFGTGKFSLDSLSNCAAIEAQWHGDLDTYGSFCITVPLMQICAIVTKLNASNRDWERRAALNPQASRNLNITEDPFVVKKCVLVVLRPDLFLPETRPLWINTRRVLRVPAGPSLPESDGSSWTEYYPQHGRPYLIDSSNQEFTEFDYHSNRRPGQDLSVFSLLVNANSKLQAAKRRAKDPIDIETISYTEIVALAVNVIFFVPRGLQKQAPSLIPPVPSLSSRQYPGVTAPGSPTQSHGDRNDLKGQDPGGVSPKDGDVVEEGHSDLDVEFDDFDYDPEEDDEEDDEPDTINGLTFSEMETVLQRVSDGTISEGERAEAAMLMLGMAGGHGHPQALSPLIKDYI
ncbi:hypothetical protein BDM02DRAFT_2747636 [Thelephora ganbajun]|uniref:Uncharacterized protein n=1 Tax=Thelephora ganbajun TaxID=370292 RepID=A0ACB6ZC13_THEGA|nr:hypothetical protein BDM02DRAFT_2747636 [Thelephora ganbajun]